MPLGLPSVPRIGENLAFSRLNKSNHDSGGFPNVSCLERGPLVRADLRRARRGLRHRHEPRDPVASRGQRAHAGDRRRHPGRRQGLPEPTVPHDRHRRRRPVHRRLAGAGPGTEHRGRLRDRRDPLGRGRLHRDERLGARERSHRAGGHQGACRGARRRVQGRRDHRHAGGGPGPAGRGRLLRHPDGRSAARAGQDRRHAHGAQAADRAGLRLVADFDLRASWRRDLHQGRRRRRRPRGQGRSRHSRGRPAQPGGDRRQRR